MFIRDRLHGGPHPVPRATATWAAFALRLSGLDLSTVTHHSPEAVADAILAAAGRYALSRHGTMTATMYHEFAGLLGVDHPAPFAVRAAGRAGGQRSRRMTAGRRPQDEAALAEPRLLERLQLALAGCEVAECRVEVSLRAIDLCRS
jgi:hypothetical protein